ncbi:MAG: hypothetical protein KKF93_04930, partial [Candidatus Omnitrophica bacterium]|nr:hypothetical protein [Candidatus Omnitrophota bacterium]
MWRLFNLRRKKFLYVWIILATLCGVFFSVQDSFAYQVKRVIRGTYDMASDEEVALIDLTASLGGVDLVPAQTAVFATGDAIDTDTEETRVFIYLDSPNGLLLSRVLSGTAYAIDYEIVEFVSGVKVIRGFTTVPDNLYDKTVTLPESIIANKSFIIHSWKSYRGANTDDENQTFAAKIVDADHIQFSRKGYASRYIADISYQVVFFEGRTGLGDANVSVEHGWDVLTSSPLTIPIASVVTNKSFLMFSVAPAANVNGNDGYYFLNGTLNDAGGGNSNAALIYRQVSTTTAIDISWSVVTFSNETFVQKGTNSFDSRTTNYPITVPTAVTTNRSFICASDSVALSSTTALDEATQRVQLYDESTLWV